MYGNANIEKLRNKAMTLSKTGTEVLTQEEWNELVALKNAINDNPATVHPEKMEKFTELLVRSLEGKYDPPEPKIA
jgi:hypothetical protein